VTLQKKKSRPSFIFISFSNPTHKIKIGIANRWGTTNSKPPKPTITIGQSKIEYGNQIKLLQSSLANAQL
jgi:hypothetical protein